MLMKDLDLKLEPALLDTVTLQFIVEREYAGERTLTVTCHYFHMDDGSLTLMRIVDGKLAVFAAYADVVALNVIDE